MLPRLCGCHSSPIGRTRQTDCSCLAGTRPRSMNHSAIGRKLQKLFQTVSFLDRPCLSGYRPSPRAHSTTGSWCLIVHVLRYKPTVESAWSSICGNWCRELAVTLSPSR